MQQWHLLEMLGQLSSFGNLFENKTTKIAELITFDCEKLEFGNPTPNPRDSVLCEMDKTGDF